MGKVIPFSQIEACLQSIKNAEYYKGTILDTNVLISATYEGRDFHTQVTGVLDILQKSGYRMFATVNTRSEFLEFQRRMVLTETLFDLVDEFSIVQLPKKARARIQTLKGSLKTSVSADPERDEVFNESQLKKIKKEFSAGSHSGQETWLKICETYLYGKIKREDIGLMSRGVEYMSPNRESQEKLFKNTIHWANTISICEKTGTAFSDSMILNALKSSKLPFTVTLDFDIGYAALSDPDMKDIIVPDRLFREYRNYHFPTND